MLFEILSQWIFQLRFSFRIRPKILKSGNFSITVFTILIVILFILFCIVWNIVNVVLAMFRESLFTNNHSLIFYNSKFIFSSMFTCLSELKALKIVEKLLNTWKDFSNPLLHFHTIILKSIFEVEYPKIFSLPPPMNLKIFWVLQNISYTPYFNPLSPLHDHSCW